MKFNMLNGFNIMSKNSSFRFVVKLIAIVPLLFMNLYSQEQGIQFTHLTSEDGLSINRVSQIMQDSRGFIWIGTSNGLNLYDGYNFKIFLPDPADSNSISSFAINTICEDNNGNIWVGTPEGLNRYDRKTGRFFVYKHVPGNRHSISNNNILSIYRGSKGNLWIGTLNGLNVYDPFKDDFTEIMKVSDRLNPDSLNSVTGIGQGKHGNIWLGTWNGLTCIKKDGKILKQFFNQPPDQKNFNYRITSVIYKDRDDNLWIGTNGKGLKKYDEKTGKFKVYKSEKGNNNSLSNNYITAIFQDKLGSMWVGTLNGLNKFNPKTGHFIRIFNDPKISSSIISNQIFTIAQDNSGLMWVGTSGGISKFYQPLNKFRYFRKNIVRPELGLTGSSIITAFIDKKDNIWVGTLNGLNEIKSNGGRIIHFKNEPGKNSVSDNFIRSVFVDRNGIVWIGTNISGLNEYNPFTGKFNRRYSRG